MAKLNAAARKSLPKQDFAVKSKAGTAQGKAKGGSYPINDESHARNALARASGKPVEGEVKAAVKRKFPNIKVGSGTLKSKNTNSRSMSPSKIRQTAARITSRLSAKSKNKTEVGFD